MIKQISKKLIDLIFDPHLFALVYLLALTLRSVYFFLDPMDYVCKACFAWGCLIIAYDVIFGKRNLFRAFRWYLPLIFVFCFGISILINMKYSFSGGVKNMIYCLLYFFVLYTQWQDITKEQLYRYLKRYNHIMIIVITLFTTVSLLTFIFNIRFLFEAGGALRHIGFWYNRLYGVWNPNTATMLGLSSIAFSAINYYIYDRKPGRWMILYLYNLIVQFVYYALSNSRATLVCIVVILAAVMIFITYPYLKAKKKVWLSLALTVVIGTASMGTVMALTGITQAIMKQVPPLTSGLLSQLPNTNNSQMQNTDNDEFNEEDGDISFDRVENFDEGGDFTNNRMGMWIAALKIVKQHPFFGISDSACLNDDGTVNGNIDASALTEADITSLKQADYFFHNGFIQILLVSGLVGLIIFLALAVSIAVRYLTFLFKAPKNNNSYKVIVIIFTLLAFIVADDFAEVHFLFTGPDAIAVIFWYFAGTGLLLIKTSAVPAGEAVSGHPLSGDSTDVRANKKQDALFAFDADTPFQTMNCINFVINNTDFSAGRSDLFLYHQFRNSREISERIKQSGVFNNVYDIEPYKKHSPLIQKFVTIYRLFWSRMAIQAACDQKLRLSQKRYQKLCISFPTPFTLGLHMAFPNAEVYHLEDGLGSYGGNITTDYSSKLFHFISQFLYDGKLDLQPVACYLSAPEFSKNTIGGELRKLPGLKPGPELEVLQKIFDYQPNDLYHERIIYLTQPLGERSIYLPEREEQLLDLLKELPADRVIVRTHPRQADEDFSGLKKDPFNNLWELECVNQITDRNVLISAFSTAQFMPKIIADVEPTVIFTYRLLFSSLDDPFLKDFAKLIDDFRGLYRSPDKIYAPDTFEELKAILARIKH